MTEVKPRKGCFAVLRTAVKKLNALSGVIREGNGYCLTKISIPQTVVNEEGKKFLMMEETIYQQYDEKALQRTPYEQASMKL